MKSVFSFALLAVALAPAACRRELPSPPVASVPPANTNIAIPANAPSNPVPLRLLTTGAAQPSGIHEATLTHDIERVKRILAANPAAVNERNDNGDTPLYIAAFRGYKIMCELLLANMADPNPPVNKRGETPLSIAVELGFPQTASILRKHGARDDDLVRGAAIRHTAVSRQTTRMAPLLAASPNLVDARNAYGQTPLYLAAITGDTNMATMLLGFKADPNATNSGGGTPFSAARERGEPTMIALLRAHGGKENNITEGADIRIAARNGLLQDVQEILKKNPELATVRDDLQRTPLHEAAAAGSQAVVQLLLQCKADPNARDFSNATPLHGAVQSESVGTVRVLLDAGADLHALNKQLDTPLHLAAARGRRDAVELLLNRGANIAARDNTAQTPLHFASLSGDARTVELLLDHRAAINAAGAMGVTALHNAALRNHIEVAKLLLARKADFSVKDSAGRTPLAIAMQNKLGEMEKLLRDAGAKE